MSNSKPKTHYWHLHGALCRTNVRESALTKWSGFVTCRNCLWLMKPVMDRLKNGEFAVGRTYSRQTLLVKRAIWELSNQPPTDGHPTIYQLSDYLKISAPRVYDICDTEQGVRMDVIKDAKGVLYDMTKARLINC